MTTYGAAAYTKFYNRRLPTYSEWMYTQRKDRSALPPAAEGKELEAMHSSMHGQTDNEFSFDAGIQKELSPVTNFTPNKFGIRGLDKGISEWGHWNPEKAPGSRGIETEFIVLPSGVIRQPWEAFEKVGFRCVQSIRSIQK